MSALLSTRDLDRHFPTAATCQTRTIGTEFLSIARMDCPCQAIRLRYGLSLSKSLSNSLGMRSLRKNRDAYGIRCCSQLPGSEARLSPRPTAMPRLRGPVRDSSSLPCFARDNLCGVMCRRSRYWTSQLHWRRKMPSLMLTNQ